jgi:hypothetical protein
MPAPIPIIGPASMGGIISRPGNVVDLEHYLRQCSISQRRQVPAIYRLWSRNLDFVSQTSQCKP